MVLSPFGKKHFCCCFVCLSITTIKTREKVQASFCGEVCFALDTSFNPRCTSWVKIYPVSSLFTEWWRFPHVQEFLEDVQQFITCQQFFLKWKLGHTHSFHSLGQDQSTVAQGWDDYSQVVLDELRVSSFPDRFLHYSCTECRLLCSQACVSKSLENSLMQCQVL